MKLFFFGILFGSAVALKLRGVSHMSDEEEISDPDAGRDFVISKFDKNNDGLSEKEFNKFVKKGGGKSDEAKQVFADLDADKDGLISKEELGKLQEVAESLRKDEPESESSAKTEEAVGA